MLDTSLADAARQQLKLSDLVVANFSPETLPEIILWQAAEKYALQLGQDFPVTLAKMYYALPVDCSFQKPTDVFMYIDPAGGGADEIGYGISAAVGPYVHLLDVGGIKGGLTDENGEKLARVIARAGVGRIKVESNMGHGLFEINLRAVLAKHGLAHVGVTGEYSTGQKERRIIDSLVSPMQRHRVIVHQQVFESDIEYGKQHSQDNRTQYSFWYQLANITTDRNSLPHDDRLEAAAGAVREHKAMLAVDENKAAEQRALAAVQQFLADPMGYGNTDQRARAGTRRVVHGRRAKR
jgi:hypothetical protein